MGIPFFFKFICKKYPECIINYDDFDINIDNLYFDLNGLIHPACSLARKKTVFVEKLTDNINKETENKILEIINIVNPKNLTMLSVDGVAPFAKINQQRSRRYKSHVYKDKLNKINSKYGINNIDFDTNMISPGTPFMNNLMDFLQELTLREGKKGRNIFLSSSNEEGEGEHKIFSDIRNNSNNINSVIYGLDADLIMLSLLTGKKNIYLLRESKEYGVDSDNLLLLDIDKLREGIVKEIYGNNNDVIRNHWKDDNLVTDYIFLCFLLGNDFIPSLTMLTIDKGCIGNIIKIYVKKLKKYNKYIIENNQINFEIFLEILEELSITEDVSLKNLHNQYFKKKYYEDNTLSPIECEIRKLDYDPLLTRDFRVNPIKFNYPGWEERYYSHYINVSIGLEEEKKKMCQNYIEALNWILLYYTGECPCWSWFYEFNTSPLVNDLIFFLKETPNPTITYRKSNCLSTKEQLISILPINSLKNIKNTKIILENYDYLFPIEFTEDYNYKIFSHQSIALLPPINYDLIKEIVRESKS